MLKKLIGVVSVSRQNLKLIDGHAYLIIMAKYKATIAKVVNEKATFESPIRIDKDQNILIQVLAKPGAKQNAITDISDEGVGIQINAPPTQGEANSELVKYVAGVLGLRKGNVYLEKGAKSRQKILKILAGNLSKQQIEEMLKKEMGH